MTNFVFISLNKLTKSSIIKIQKQERVLQCTKNDIKDLKKFIRPSPAIFIVGTIWGLIGIIILIVSIFENIGEDSTMIIVGAVMLVMGIIIAVSGIYILKKADKRLAEIYSKGSTQILLNDFRTGGKAFKDLLILGQTFLIGKHTGTVITYSNIIQIYQYVHKTNYVEDSRILKAVIAPDRKVVDLCRIPLSGKGDDELRQVIGFIVSKNENIKVGYK